jgi:bacitracin export ATP-binding protein bceA
LFIKDGVVFHELRKGNATTNEMFQKINDTLSLMQAGE